MFSRAGQKATNTLNAADFSHALKSGSAWKQADLSSFGIVGEIACLAYDPVASLLCVGTAAGQLYLFGRPGIQISWSTRPTHPIKLLSFRPNTSLLIAIDSKDTLTLYDLSQLSATQEPHRKSVHSLRSNATCLEVSPYISHAFIGFKDGTVDAFDCDSGKSSSHYRIPNCWLEQEELLRRSGIPNAPSRRHIPMCVDVKMHPTDLNVLLIAYEGGVVLWNFRDKVMERAYELCFPPGAPGGSGDRGDALFSERRPQVTCCAWRPDGLVFVVGHDDGSLAFWSTLDEDKPVDVRTFDRNEIHLANAESLFEDPSIEEQAHGRPLREPIFKLAWSGFKASSLADNLYARFAGSSSSSTIPPTAEETAADSAVAGSTTLTIMGGTLPSDPVGIHVLTLPPYAASYGLGAGPASSPNLAPATRQALKDSVAPIAHTFFFTPTPPEDFILLPQSPYYGSAFDSSAILITYGTDERLPDLPSQLAPTRSFAAYSFPPHPHGQQQSLSLPPLLGMTGEFRTTKAIIETCTGQAYSQLQAMRISNIPPPLPLNGGKATPRQNSQGAGQQLHSSAVVLERKKILITAHLNLHIRFWDISSSLLALPQKSVDPSASLELGPNHYPNLLAEIDIRHVLLNSRKLVAGQLYRSTPSLISITDFSVSLESLEVAIALSTGEMILYRFGHLVGAHDSFADDEDGPTEQFAELQVQPESAPDRRRSILKPFRPKESTRRATPAQETRHAPSAHVNLIDLGNANPIDQSAVFSAVFGLPASGNSVSCVSLSNVGFMAVAWTDGTLVILDLRGPDVVLQQKVAGSCKVMSWAICGVDRDTDRGLRLIASYDNGTTRVYTLKHALHTWLCNAESIQTSEHGSLTRPLTSCALDPRGRLCEPDGQALQSLLNDMPDDGVAKDELLSVLIVAAKHSVSAISNTTGTRFAKYESTLTLIAAKVISKENASAILLLAEDTTVIALSLPGLKEVYRSQRMPGSRDSRLRTAASISSEGDYCETFDSQITLSTSFDFSRFAFPPNVTLSTGTHSLVESPFAGDLAKNVSSWWGSHVQMTAASLDEILGGPGRPKPKPKPQQPAAGSSTTASPAAASGSWFAMPAIPAMPSFGGGQEQRHLKDVPETRAARAEMQRTNQALEERGELLSNLNDSMNNIGQGAKDMLKEAKGLAFKQGLKSKFGSYM